MPPAGFLAGLQTHPAPRPRWQVGPRALGHRSLLAYPDREEVKARLNAIKGRQVSAPGEDTAAIFFSAANPGIPLRRC